MKEVILSVILIATVVMVGKTIYETNKAYNYLEAKTKWCYEQNGIMIEVHCFSKDMKLIEIPPNSILDF